MAAKSPHVFEKYGKCATKMHVLCARVRERSQKFAAEGWLAGWLACWVALLAGWLAAGRAAGRALLAGWLAAGRAAGRRWLSACP